MKNLQAYLKEVGETQKDFAERIGISPEHLSGVINGRYKPSERLRRHIALATGGRVEPAE